MHELSHIRVVEQIDRHRDALMQADQRAGDLPVVGCRGNRMVIRDVGERGANAKRDIGWSPFTVRRGWNARAIAGRNGGPGTEAR